MLALRILTYLKTLPDLELRLEASDATCRESIRSLVGNITPTLAGCMLLSAVIIDKFFLSQTDENFRKVFAPKKEAFEALEDSFPLASLDFLVAFSSISSLGNAGQTNYSRYACVFMTWQYELTQISVRMPFSTGRYGSIAMHSQYLLLQSWTLALG